MAKLVPIQISEDTVFYIEAQAEPIELEPIPANPIEAPEEQRRGGAKGMGDLKLPTLRTPNPAQSMQMVQSTIRAYTLYCLSAFKNFNVANIDEVTLEFGIGLSADAGVPFIASGKAQSNLKITVKCSYNKPEPANGKAEG